MSTSKRLESQFNKAVVQGKGPVSHPTRKLSLGAIKRAMAAEKTKALEETVHTRPTIPCFMVPLDMIAQLPPGPPSPLARPKTPTSFVVSKAPAFEDDPWKTNFGSGPYFIEVE